ERERQTVARVFPDPGRDGKDLAHCFGRGPAQGVETRVELPATWESDRTAHVAIDGCEDTFVEVDEGLALPITLGVLVGRLDEVLLGRRAKAEQADEAGHGRRAAPVHPENEDPRSRRRGAAIRHCVLLARARRARPATPSVRTTRTARRIKPCLTTVAAGCTDWRRSNAAPSVAANS